MVNPSARTLILFSIKEYIMGRNLMDVMNVEKFLVRALILFNIKESIRGRNLMNVMNVKKTFTHRSSLRNHE